MKEPSTKGQTFRSFVRALGKLRGDAVVEGTLARAPQEVRDALGAAGKILPSGWYPIRWLTELHKAAALATGGGLALSRAIGREATAADYRGIYRFFAVVLSPEGILSRAPRAFSLTWDTGDASVVESRPRHIVIEFSGCVGFNAWLWEVVIGASTALLELGGAKNIEIRVVAGGGDAPEMRMEARWD
ncbi:hypothetical protein BH11MYX4_BH11MYX4_07290 [soil metagenome]